jgi:predicted nucleic-acid-binding protein
MKALDTNVLVRYLVQDDPRQGRRAADFIEAAGSREEQILIGNIVLCELVWVLESAYGYKKAEIADAMQKILQAAAFRFESKDIVRAALGEYGESTADFADCLMGRIHRSLGCETTVTFDTALRKLQTFQLL